MGVREGIREAITGVATEGGKHLQGKSCSPGESWLVNDVPHSARVVELADTTVLEAVAARLAGSSPVPGTTFRGRGKKGNGKGTNYLLDRAFSGRGQLRNRGRV